MNKLNLTPSPGTYLIEMIEIKPIVTSPSSIIKPNQDITKISDKAELIETFEEHIYQARIVCKSPLVIDMSYDFYNIGDRILLNRQMSFRDLVYWNKKEYFKVVMHDIICKVEEEKIDENINTTLEIKKVEYKHKNIKE
jgi:hypothetical protein